MSQMREGDQLLLRLPPGMKLRLMARAMSAKRSMAAEVIDAIENYLNADTLANRVERIEKHLGLEKKTNGA